MHCADQNKIVYLGYLVEQGEGSYQKLMNADFDHTGYYKLMVDNGGIKVVEIVGLDINET